MVLRLKIVKNNLHYWGYNAILARYFWNLFENNDNKQKEAGKCLSLEKQV